VSRVITAPRRVIRNPKYFGKWTPRVDTVRKRIVRGIAAYARRMNDGGCDAL
jgi:hypothetical protein